MPNRFEWSEILIVGVVGGIAASCVTLAALLGASTDNLLNFFGSAVGSGLAVVAALWLESRRRARALEQMMTSLVITASVAMRFEPKADELVAPLIVTFQQSAAAFEAARLGANIEDPLHQYAFQSAVFWLRRVLKEMEAGLQDLAEGKLTEGELAQKVRKPALGIIKPIEDFLKLPGLPTKPLAAFRYHKARMDTAAQIETLSRHSEGTERNQN